METDIKINLLILCLAIFLSTDFAWSQDKYVDLTSLSIEELMEIKVTSVSKKKETLFDSAGAIYVVTSEDIRRSGVRSIPEALRMVPGVEVASVDANKWAVTIRGFNDRFATKLLVLIDGRTVYTPLFSGIFWEEIDTVLEDIDRIEVIRGPGGTLWGANAVNGVINIITKSAENTQGAYIKAGAGNEEQGFVDLRYGDKISNNIYYRFFGKFFNRDDFGDAQKIDNNDAWRSYRGGFRVDWKVSEKDNITFQGDIYRLDFNETISLARLSAPFFEAIDTDGYYTGGNLLFRWTRDFSNISKATLQLYNDMINRETLQVDMFRNTFDIDFQHNITVGNTHNIVWGLGYRLTTDDISETDVLKFRDDNRTDSLWSAFIQDRISFFDNRFFLTVGSKFEHNGFSGFEVQPNVRLLGIPHEDHRIWGSLSRAVRTPSRLSDGLRYNLSTFSDPDTGLTTLLQLSGNPDFDPEELLAFEFGYRFKSGESVFIDFASFVNIYKNLSTFEPRAPSLDDGVIVVPVFFDNKADGTTYGFELSANWTPFEFWKLKANYSYINIDISADGDSLDTQADAPEGRSPSNQFKFQSYLDLPHDFQLDTTVYYVDDLSFFDISDYFRLDLRLGWQPVEGLDISFIGQNLLDGQHSEFGRTFFHIPTKVERSLYGSLTWKF